MHLVESDAEAQRALTHLTNIGTQDALGVMCLGELSKQGSVCYALVRGWDRVTLTAWVLST